jgi:hypothetical protein
MIFREGHHDGREGKPGLPLRVISRDVTSANGFNRHELVQNVFGKVGTGIAHDVLHKCLTRSTYPAGTVPRRGLEGFDTDGRGAIAPVKLAQSSGSIRGAVAILLQQPSVSPVCLDPVGRERMTSFVETDFAVT